MGEDGGVGCLGFADEHPGCATGLRDRGRGQNSGLRYCGKSAKQIMVVVIDVPD